MSLVCRRPTAILTWGPQDAARDPAPIARAYLYNPDIPGTGKGPMPRVLSITLSSRRETLTPPSYDVAVAPEWIVGWVDPLSDIGRAAPAGGEFIPPAALVLTPADWRPIYYEAPMVRALVRIDNRGRGFDWPMVNPGRAFMLYIAAAHIGTECRVDISPQFGVPG